MDYCKSTKRHPILTKSVELIGVTGHELKVLGSTELVVDNIGRLELIVVDGINHPLIIGRDLLRADKAIIDYNQGTVTWRGQNIPLLPKTVKSQIASLGPKPPVVGSSAVQDCVQQNQHVFSAKGEDLGCHPRSSPFAENTC